VSLDQWEQTFLDADPERYHQFRNKTPAKKIQMAQSARKHAIEKN
jgi:hypothetical protein